jgi:hypothetical protein
MIGSRIGAALAVGLALGLNGHAAAAVFQGSTSAGAQLNLSLLPGLYRSGPFTVSATFSNPVISGSFFTNTETRYRQFERIDGHLRNTGGNETWNPETQFLDSGVTSLILTSYYTDYRYREPALSSGSGPAFEVGTVRTIVAALQRVEFGGSGPTDYLIETTGPATVPEPATWALLILGFGLAGAGLRRASGFGRATACSVSRAS